jgi:hypothetical protein
MVSCSNRQVSLGEQFSLQQNEKVRISGEPISLQLEGIGRDFEEDGEYAFADLVVQMDGGENGITLYVGEEWRIDDYGIEMISADPFGDPVRCELIVTKVK